MTSVGGDRPPERRLSQVQVHPQGAPGTDLDNPKFGSRLSTRERVREIQAHAKLALPLIRQFLRLLTFATAVVYVLVCVMAVSASISILRKQESREIGPVTFPSRLIPKYIGSGTIDKSPLVQDVLGGDTLTVRSDAVYLESEASHSLSNCSKVASFNSKLYGAVYLRFMFDHLRSQLAYNVTLMADLELVVPVVDCTLEFLVTNDITAARVYFLVRRSSDPSSLVLLSTSMSIQNYDISSQSRRGPALLTSIAFISDMSTTRVNYSIAIALNYPYESTPKFIACEVVSTTTDGFWQLRTIPRNPDLSSRTDIVSARREGFYIDNMDSQSNIKNYHWRLFRSDPVAEVSEWSWHGETVLRDSWAWAHCIHGIFGFYTAFQLLLLFFVMFQRFRRGYIWVGDAFSSISSALLYRGILVFLANQLNGFYTWTEYSLALGYSLKNTSDTMYYRSDLLFPGLLTIYLNVVAIVSYVFRERISPLVAFGSFSIGFIFRVDQARLVESFRRELVAFAEINYELGEAQVGEAIESLSPFHLRTVSHVDMETRGGAIAAAITSVAPGLVCIGMFIFWQKLHRFFKRRRSSRMDSYRHTSANDSRRRSSAIYGKVAQMKLTLFETATGAALQKRFGVISSYENYVEVGGRRYATADAVYSNGFLVANRKFLVATSDLLPILLIKLTRVRFKNVFVYELTDGDTAKQTARLLYPQTIDWRDLIRLDVCNLA